MKTTTSRGSTPHLRRLFAGPERLAYPMRSILAHSKMGFGRWPLLEDRDLFDFRGMLLFRALVLAGASDQMADYLSEIPYPIGDDD